MEGVPAERRPRLCRLPRKQSMSVSPGWRPEALVVGPGMQLVLFRKWRNRGPRWFCPTRVDPYGIGPSAMSLSAHALEVQRADTWLLTCGTVLQRLVLKWLLKVESTGSDRQDRSRWALSGTCSRGGNQTFGKSGSSCVGNQPGHDAPVRLRARRNSVSCFRAEGNPN